MKNYEAIKNLTPELLEKFLYQVFLTGLNIGHHSIADPELDDSNPYDFEWLNKEIAGTSAIVEGEMGELVIIENLLDIVRRIYVFTTDDTKSVPNDAAWEPQITLPKEMNDKQNCEC